MSIKMKKLLFLSFLVASLSAAANPVFQPENINKVATPNTPEISIKKSKSEPERLEVTLAELEASKELTEKWLNLAIYQDNVALIEKLLPIYANFVDKDYILQLFAQAQLQRSQGKYQSAVNFYREILAQRPELNPVRVELAITLFENQQNDVAQQQFELARSQPDLPLKVQQQIDQYLTALNKRNEWQVSASMTYLRDKNVNNASPELYIDNPYLAKLRKNDSMLPQKAEGFAYQLGIAKDFNLVNQHYLHFENSLYGKFYWDNQKFNDIINRTYLGYAYKSAVQKIQLLPFYQRRWYGEHRYSQSHGARLEYNYWFTPKWQLSSALEYSKKRYRNDESLNGDNRYLSNTLLWQSSPNQYWYLGWDINHEKTKVRQYSYHQNSLRLGWGRAWQWGISSRISLSASRKHYQAPAKIGAIPLKKIRQDKIYQASLILWKRDWHLWEITPKLQLRWYKQQSNLPSLYSYSDKNVNLLFEKQF